MTHLESRMIERFDHHDPEFSGEGTPQRVYRQLRERCPLSWSDAHGGFWVASKYADIDAVVRDPDTFASAAGILIPDPNDALTPAEQQERFEMHRGIVGPPVSYDPPVHAPIRRKLEPLFTPGMVRTREDYIRGVCNKWIDTFIADGKCELVTQYCAPVPTIVVLDWLGLDVDDWRVWSDAVLDQFANPGQYGVDMSAVDLGKLLATVQARKDNPADDVITAITEIRIDGEPLHDLEMMALLGQLVFAGLDTTTNATTSTFVELYRRPQLRAELARTPHDDRLWATAIEEFLRYTCPIQGFKRTARTEATVAGQTIEPGQRLMVLWASANFDDGEFQNPEEINIHRTTNRHMSFGRGIHRCLGSHLARLEMKVMMQEILRRLPDYTIDESLLDVHHDVGISYGYDAVPIEFGAGGAVSAGAAG